MSRIPLKLFFISLFLFGCVNDNLYNDSSHMPSSGDIIRESREREQKDREHRENLEIERLDKVSKIFINRASIISANCARDPSYLQLTLIDTQIARNNYRTCVAFNMKRPVEDFCSENYKYSDDLEFQECYSEIMQRISSEV